MQPAKTKTISQAAVGGTGLSPRRVMAGAEALLALGASFTRVLVQNLSSFVFPRGIHPTPPSIRVSKVSIARKSKATCRREGTSLEI